MGQLTRENLLRHLRDALNHLHDAEFLRRSPLATLFDVANRLDTSLALRNILIAAIDALKPGEGGPPTSRAWQMHDALYCCYVQRLSQQVVADQLAVSVRQLRREQQAALEALADHLCQQYHLEARLAASSSCGAVGAQHAAPLQPIIGEELAWLKDLPPEKPTDLQETLAVVLDLVQPLAAPRAVRFQIQMADNLPKLAVHPVALTQILVGLLGVVVSHAQSAEVRIAARLVEWSVQIDVAVDAVGVQHAAPLRDEDAASLYVARQIVEMCGGTVAIDEKGNGLEVAVNLPALERLPVLVIDDNADTIQLLQRYTAGTRYHLIGVRDPEQALSLAESLRPEIIVLDVMMPQMDGWRALGHLRQHPLTGHIPLVVCTILPQEGLALALGASAFVRKPVTRQAFLDALERTRGPVHRSRLTS